MSTFRIYGNVCQISDWYEIDGGTLARTASPLPGLIGHPSTPKAEPVSKDDQAEFDQIKKHVGVLDAQGRKYKDAAAYVKDRNEFFGSEADYQKFSAESDAELESTEWKSGKRTIKLRQLIEINKHPEAQDVFYRWVRKAYFKKLGDDADVPEIIHAGMVPELIEAIKKGAATGTGEVAIIPQGAAGRGSTLYVDFHTTKPIYPVTRCHLNAMVADTKKWEQSAAFLLDSHPGVVRWVKNDRLGFTISYRHRGLLSNYVPDFIVVTDRGELTAGIVVDAVCEVCNVSPEKLRPAPEMGSAVDADSVRGLAMLEDRMLILLSIDRLVGASLIDTVIEQKVA